MTEKPIIKAKIKKTGDIIEVEKISDALYRNIATSGVDEKTFYDSDLDFQIEGCGVMVDDEEFWAIVDKAAKIVACDCGDGLDEPAYDLKVYEGFKKGVKWILSRQFAMRMSSKERLGITDSFRNLEKSYLESLKNLSQIKMFFGELF